MLSVSIFNVARYLTDSLRGPVLAHYSEADRPSLMGWLGWMGWKDGWDGMGRSSKVSFNFFYFKIYKTRYAYIHKYIYIYKYIV